ncbi:GGDEF domain-containing protein [Vibrio vulnificus]|uniref:GGDEF domain-containing protein n=1 Tax=Vibrio vulnificus TaxID=672 RepID=UPI004057FDFF
MMKLLMLSNVKFQQLSITDKLTQLPNRLYIEDLLVSSKQVYWIVILDVDDFKKINDNYGHDVGDRVLQIIANKIQKNVSGSGVACRWGGEEFLIAFYLQDIEMVKETIVRLQQDVVSFDFGLNQSITFSCGGAPHQPRHYRNAFCQADEALYRAKKAGKNSFFYDLVAKDS